MHKYNFNLNDLSEFICNFDNNCHMIMYARKQTDANVQQNLMFVYLEA